MTSDEPEIDPGEFLRFVELEEFHDDWLALGLGAERELWDLQLSIMENPNAAPVIPGTGGLRKMRYSPRSWKVGKRGAVRVCYAYFEQHLLVLLVMVYAKGRKDTLSAEEKKSIHFYLQQCNAWLDRHDRRKERDRG